MCLYNYYFYCHPHVGVLKDCLKFIQVTEDSIGSAAFCIKQRIREKYSLLSKVQSNRDSTQIKQAPARKPVGNQGRKIKIRFFRGEWYQENTMLFATEFF